MSGETPGAADSLSLRLEELSRQVASTMETTVRTVAEEASADASRRVVDDLLQAVAVLEDGKDQTEIIGNLLEIGCQLASRTAFFLIRPGTVRGWGGKGFEGGDDDTLRNLSFDYSDESPWAELVEGRGVVRLSKADCESLARRLEVDAAEEGLLIPFVLRDQLGGAIYADRLSGSAPVGEPGLQLLTHSAARAIETLAFRARRSPTLRRLESEHSGLPLWDRDEEEAAVIVEEAQAEPAEQLSAVNLETIESAPKPTVSDADGSWAVEDVAAPGSEEITPEVELDVAPVVESPVEEVAIPDIEPVLEDTATMETVESADAAGVVYEETTLEEAIVDETGHEAEVATVEEGLSSGTAFAEEPAEIPAVNELPAFEPESPAFETEAPAFEPEAPTFEAEVPAFEPGSPTFESEAPAFDAPAGADPGFALETADEIPAFEPPSLEDAPGFAAGPGVDTDLGMSEPTLEELSGDLSPEPELEDTSTDIWSLEDDDEDDTAVGEAVATSSEVSDATAEVEYPVTPTPPADAGMPLGQQTVRLDIAALQGQMATPEPAAPEPPVPTFAAPEPVAPEPVAPEPALPEPVPLDAPFAGTTPEVAPALSSVEEEENEEPTYVGEDTAPQPVAPAFAAPEPAAPSYGFASPAEEAYVPPAPTPEPDPEPEQSSAYVPAPAEPASAGASAEEQEEPKAADSGSTQVQPPADLEGPGLAFASSQAVTSDAEDAMHEEARRLARLLVSEIKLYNEEIIEEGRRNSDIYNRLKDDIDRSRQMYEERIDPRIRGQEDYFQQELVQRLAGGDRSLLGPM